MPVHAFTLLSTYDVPIPKTFQLSHLYVGSAASGCLFQLFLPCLTMSESTSGKQWSKKFPPRILVAHRGARPSWIYGMYYRDPSRPSILVRPRITFRS